MGNELQTINKDLQDIKLEYGALWSTVKNSITEATKGTELSDMETLLYIRKCKAIGADPLSQDIYPIRYGKKIAFLTSIQQFRKMARRNPGFRGVDVTCDYDKDGKLIGATAIAKHRHGPDDIEEHKVSVLLKEFKGGGKWNSMPEWLIKKVAESHSLRALYPEDFTDTYSEEERDQFKQRIVSESDETKSLTRELLDQEASSVPDFIELEPEEGERQ